MSAQRQDVSMNNFDRNVFINCPFDNSYRPLLMVLVFTVVYLGYKPRLSFERSDSAEARIDKIVGLINDSKYGIHDLSRMVSKDENEHMRMNMPFELGIDYGCKKLKGGMWSDKQLLVLDKERYRFHRSLSDLSGSDIKHHDDDEIKLIKAVREWFVGTEKLKNIPSHKVIWNIFNDFQAFLHDKLVEQEGHDSVDDVQEVEVIDHMIEWLEAL